MSLPVRSPWSTSATDPPRTIAFSIVGNYWAISHYPFQRDPGLAGALITIWQVVEAAYSLAAVTIAASKAFADAFATGFGWGDTFREVGNSQYMMESAASRSRTAPSRGGTRVGDRSGHGLPTSGTMTSQHELRDNKNISPMATNMAEDEEDAPGSTNSTIPSLTARYHQNEYNYGRPSTRDSDKTRSNNGSWRRKDITSAAAAATATATSSYVDPLEDEHDDDAPMRLRPERKLRNTAIIEHDPSVAAMQRRPERESGTDKGSDDMYIVRNVDYSVRYDQAPHPHAAAMMAG